MTDRAMEVAHMVRLIVSGELNTDPKSFTNSYFRDLFAGIKGVFSDRECTNIDDFKTTIDILVGAIDELYKELGKDKPFYIKVRESVKGMHRGIGTPNVTWI